MGNPFVLRGSGIGFVVKKILDQILLKPTSTRSKPYVHVYYARIEHSESALADHHATRIMHQTLRP